MTDDGDPAPGDSSAPPLPESTPPVNGDRLAEFDPAGTYKQVKVGTRDGVAERFGPHDVVVWNALERETRVSTRILDRVAETTVQQVEYRIPADQAVSVTLLAPSRYFVHLWGPAIESPETLLVPCSMFDCNSSATRLGVLDGGDVRSMVISSLADCPSPDC